MFPIAIVLAVLAFALTIGAAIGKVPLWIPVFLLALLALLQAGGVS